MYVLTFIIHILLPLKTEKQRHIPNEQKCVTGYAMTCIPLNKIPHIFIKILIKYVTLGSSEQIESP